MNASNAEAAVLFQIIAHGVGARAHWQVIGHASRHKIGDTPFDRFYISRDDAEWAAEFLDHYERTVARPEIIAIGTERMARALTYLEMRRRRHVNQGELF